MTEQEAINILNGIDEVHGNLPEDGNDVELALMMARNALEEIQKYRALGTVKQIQIREAQVMQLSEAYLDSLRILREYQSLGPVKEPRKAMDKQRATKPNIWGDGYDDNGNIIYDMYDCPNCNKSYEIDYDKHYYCPNCGQALDWS